jgi:hypothetical protein
LVPVIVRVESAAGVVPEVVTVRVDVPVLPTMVEGLKLAVAPVGRPETVKATSPLNPFSAVLLTEYVVLPPTTTACVAGVAVKAKPGTGITVSVTLVTCVTEPAVPVIPIW